MNNVVISPNVKRTSDRIDVNGNVLNKQKQIIQPVESEYVPPTVASMPIMPVEEPKQSSIEKMIEAKISALVEKKVEEILSKIL